MIFFIETIILKMHFLTMNNASILIVEDEPPIQELIRFNLENSNYSVITCDSGEEVEDIVQADKPDLILLDIMLPGINGLEICKRLQADTTSQKIPIIILSALGEESDIINGLELGASDYISKPFSPKILLARVKSALRRSNFALEKDHKTETTDNEVIKIDPVKFKVTVNDRAIKLTMSEYKILELLSCQPGRVYTRYQIVDSIHGEYHAVTDRSIDVQIVGLRKKLGQAGSYIETVRGVGYRMREDFNDVHD